MRNILFNIIYIVSVCLGNNENAGVNALKILYCQGFQVLFISKFCLNFELEKTIILRYSGEITQQFKESFDQILLHTNKGVWVTKHWYP